MNRVSSDEQVTNQNRHASLPTRAEIVIALVGAVGTDLRMSEELVRDILRSFGYQVELIGLSGQLERIVRDEKLPSHDATALDQYTRIRMDAGDDLRSSLDRGDAVAMLAVDEIQHRRAQLRNGSSDPPSVAYVLRSLKRPEEYEQLDIIYSERFVLIGAHAPAEARIRKLARDIAASYGSTKRDEYMRNAYELAVRDEADEAKKWGQKVRELFPQADFFVDVSDRSDAKRELHRFMEAFFDHKYHTPSRDENAMFHAHASALRSADLSRQVGAAIATDDGDIVAVGCNEVPRFGGGAYWERDAHDQRDFQIGIDPNHRMRGIAIEEIFGRLKDWIKERDEAAKTAKNSPGSAYDTFVSLFDDEADAKRQFRDALKGTRVDSLTEFNRAVHAEMAALTDAARKGISVEGATLYTTTFPCHNCTKHIVAAGIRRVVYVEPYVKSLAEDLQEDSITVDRALKPDNYVHFEPFVGVSSTLYMPLFRHFAKRQKDGRAIPFDPLAAKPKLVLGEDPSYLLREAAALEEFRQKLGPDTVELKLRPSGGAEHQGGGDDSVAAKLGESSSAVGTSPPAAETAPSTETPTRPDSGGS
jgi:deoxycytidylate deaminase